MPFQVLLQNLGKMQKFQKSGAVSCKFKGRQCQPSILHFLTGKKFVRILKSEVWIFHGVLFWQGQRKADWHSKKILSKYAPFSLYHNILHFLMYVVWLSRKHYRKIFWSCTKGSGWSLLQSKNLTVQGTYLLQNVFYLSIYFYLWTVMFTKNA